MTILPTKDNHPIHSPVLARGSSPQISKKLVESARVDVAAVLSQLGSTPNGLSQTEVEARLEQYGLNEVAKEKRRTWLARLWDNIKNPLVILLIVWAPSPT